MCDADLIGRLDDESPVRVTSTVTPRMRRHVFARDKDGCCVPGCRSARNLDLHHVEFQSHGGTHNAANVCCVCSSHHRQLHAGKLVITGCAPNLTFQRIPDHDAEIPALAGARANRRRRHQLARQRTASVIVRRISCVAASRANESSPYVPVLSPRFTAHEGHQDL
jgi:hypothetical protein